MRSERATTPTCSQGLTAGLVFREPLQGPGLGSLTSHLKKVSYEQGWGMGGADPSPLFPWDSQSYWKGRICSPQLLFRRWGSFVIAFCCFNTKEPGFLCPDQATTHLGAAPTLPAGCLCPMGLKDWIAMAIWVQSLSQLTPEAPPIPPSGG